MGLNQRGDGRGRLRWEGKGGRDFRNKYKGHMDKTKGRGVESGEGGWDGWGEWGRGERKMQTTVLEQQ